MARLVTLFTGQWADLEFEVMCQKASEMGYEGLEIACWGNHLNPSKAVEDDSYVSGIKDTLAKYNLKCEAIGSHLLGQCIGDYNDKRLNAFAPKELWDKPDEIREWATKEMKNIVILAKKMGVSIVTGFLGSTIWKYLYSFPPTTEEMIEEGFDEIERLWRPIFKDFTDNNIKFAFEVHPGEIAYDY